ncbi:MAG: hypothetical protein J5610_01785 [Prevotella sp.]|nr:hypothetical protein [Prevotella sp.]
MSSKKCITTVIALCMAVLAIHADVDAEYSFEGTLGDKIPVEISFCVNGDGIAVGEILYTKAKSPTPILIVGYAEEWGYAMNEYQADGTITGSLSMIIEEDGGKPSLKEGTWFNPKTGKEFQMKNMKLVSTSVDVPKYMDYEKADNIGTEYSYQIWNSAYESMMGGTACFKYIGEHKVHFEVSNASHNIAEGQSAPDRPAVLGDYTYDYFNYDNVNECGYGFSAYFFKRFVVLRTTSGPDTYGCFGMGASFDGVYMKIK